MEKIDDDIWLRASLLNPNECAAVIEEAEANKFHVARNYHEFGRHNHEMFLQSSETLQKLLVRLKEEVCQEQAINFRVIGLRKILECYRYQEGEFVAPHSDAPTEIEPNTWSAFTLVIYLSDDFQGGETVFPAKGLKLRLRLGQAVLFKQSLRHGGCYRSEGNKIYSSCEYCGV